MEVPELGAYKDMDWPDGAEGACGDDFADGCGCRENIAAACDKVLGIDDNTVVMFTSDNGPSCRGRQRPDV